MAKPKVEWVDHYKAMAMLGFSSEEAMHRHIVSGELKIAWTQVNQKARRFYNKYDIERVLLEHSTLVG